jgi:hypothetical protein
MVENLLQVDILSTTLRKLDSLDPRSPPPPHHHHHSWSRLFIAFLRRVFSSSLASFHPQSYIRIYVDPPTHTSCNTSTFSFRSYPGFHLAYTYLISLAQSPIVYRVSPPPPHQPSRAAIDGFFAQQLEEQPFGQQQQQQPLTAEELGCLSRILWYTFIPPSPCRLMHSRPPFVPPFIQPFLCLGCLFGPFDRSAPSPHASCWYLVIDMHPHSF